ncbi:MULTISPECIES: amidase family protein [unclassified Pseudomonas]|jgi:amidase|uniref:amidase family protein n=2 Tax=Pseudomonas TaxID=286 RepID=UPI0021CC5136|nr:MULTISPECIES: amidase family protein [unclassified Pseudomonas]
MIGSGVGIGLEASGFFEVLAAPPKGYRSAQAMSSDMARAAVTSESLVRDSLQGIANIDQGLQGGNAFLQVNPDAREQARARDQERAGGTVRGFLHGVPIALKDVFETSGKMHTSAGSRALVGSPATKNAKVVDNLLKAGAVIVGKTNMSELSNFRSSVAVDGWSSRGGQTLNPHRLGGQVAGSSSGSAVAVAQGLVPLALGIETNGSIIAPAAYNGVVGLKTSVGLVSTEGVITSSRLDSVGTFTRSVRDAGEALNAMTETTGYTAGLTANALQGKRIGYTPLPELSPQAAQNPALRADRKHYEDALALLASKGAVMVPIGRLDANVSNETYDQYSDALFAGIKQRLEGYLAGREGLPVKSLAELIAFNERDRKTGEPDQALLEHINSLDVTHEQREQLWAAVLPTFKDTLDKPLSEHRLDAIVSNFRSDSYYFAAAAGYPGISVPSGMDEEGMPTALHFCGTGNSEATLLSVAHGYEQASQAIREPAFRPGVPLSSERV